MSFDSWLLGYDTRTAVRASNNPTVGIATGMAALVALLVLAPARPARADDGQQGGSPWFPLVDPEAPQETFDRNTLGIVRVGESGWRANRGKYRSLLDRHDFFVTVGRLDLARHQASSAATSRVVFWSGIAGMGTGALLFYAHVSEGGFDPSFRTCLLFVGGGLLATWISTWITGPTVSSDEAEEMALRYNDQLKLHIEREIGSPPTRPLQAAAPAPKVVPWTDGRSAGGLALRAVF